jgi:hypothetical protein
MVKLIVFLFFSFLLNGCGTEKVTEIRPAPDPQQPNPNPDNGNGNVITFNRDVRPILDEHCALSGCHGSAPFQTGDAFKEFGGPNRVIDGSMPPRYSPKYSQWTDTEKDIILLWNQQNF